MYTAPDGFAYTFDRISEIVEAWLIQIGFTSFGLYHQDYGGPIGNRIVGRHPEWHEWQTVQNSNAYEEGFTAVWDGIRFELWKERTKETEDALRPFLETEGIKSIYLAGHPDPELISPDNWTMDIFFTPEGGDAYLRDLPDAEIHRLDAGHFAVEDHADEIASGMARFYNAKVAAR